MLADELELNGRFDEADAAPTIARRHRRDLEASVRLLRKEGVIRERQGKYSQALRWYGRGLAAIGDLTAEATPRDARRAILRSAYAGVRFRQGRLWDTVRWARRAEAAAKDLDDPRMRAHSAYLLMTAYGVLRRPEVVEYRDVALPLFEQLGDWMYQGNVLNNLGVDAKEEGRWSEALELYERSRVARQEAGDVIGAAITMHNIGEILSDQGHLDEAQEHFESALRSWRRAGYAMGMGVGAESTSADSTCAEVTSTRLVRCSRRGSNASRRWGRRTSCSRPRCSSSSARCSPGTVRRLLPRPRRVFELAAEVGDPLLEAMLLRSKAWAHFEQGEYDEAEELADRCLSVAEGIGATYEVALALVMRGQVRAATGGDRKPDHTRARELLSQLGVVSLRLRSIVDRTTSQALHPAVAGNRRTRPSSPWHDRE